MANRTGDVTTRRQRGEMRIDLRSYFAALFAGDDQFLFAQDGPDKVPDLPRVSRHRHFRQRVVTRLQQRVRLFVLLREAVGQWLVGNRAPRDGQAALLRLEDEALLAVAAVARRLKGIPSDARAVERFSLPVLRRIVAIAVPSTAPASAPAMS